MTPSSDRRWFHEPLLHFMAIGLLLFAVFVGFSREDRSNSRLIEVTEDVLLEFMQYRNQTFSGEARDRLRASLKSMTPAERAALVDEYLREEVLHREALSMGLDKTDYVIRRRLAQTMEYILQDTVEQETPAPASDILRGFFNAHRDRYSSPARVSLTHIYFDSSRDGTDAKRRADRALALLRNDTSTTDAAQKLGDRFPYFQDYIDENAELIESHFGAEIAKAAFAGSDTGVWQGPLRSRTGYHLIRVSKRTPARTPEFAEVEDIVLADWRKDELKKHLEDRIRSLMNEYRIERAAAVGPTE